MIRKVDENLLKKVKCQVGNKSIVVRSKPQLSVVELQVIICAINKSIEDHSPLWLKVFYTNYDRVLHGIVMTANYQLQQIEFGNIRDKLEWVKIENILNII
ncbi:YolD-like family protein [Paenibacillus odorifer]|uniref:YolD-like family protein n=1 Tax=Paenibacillus odorifer TaxID=189426 RepID=UPI00096FED76|nr:YolD-like family protein [Paenibacillus odorifer]OME10736.1 hypothetical protein BSK60_23825 [Paenibacillus odorifer]